MECTKREDREREERKKKTALLKMLHENQWLDQSWPQAKVHGSSLGGDSQHFLQTFPFAIPSTSEHLKNIDNSASAIYMYIYEGELIDKLIDSGASLGMSSVW